MEYQEAGKQWASITVTADGVQVIGNDPAEQKHYFLSLTWEELFQLARGRGKMVTTEQMAKMSQKGIRDIMEGP